MAWAVRRSVGSCLLITTGLVYSLACDELKNGSQKTTDSSRFELKQDNQGRVIRLDKVTGEVVVVDGTKLVPLKPEAAIRTPVNRPPASPKAVSSAPPVQEQRADPVAMTTEPVTLQPPDAPNVQGDASRSAPAVVGHSAVLIAATPVFVTARGNQTPLMTLSKGAVVRVRAVEGDWYEIEFDDPRWGKRVGFVAKRNATADYGNLQPVDLSIRDPKVKPVIK